MHTVPVREPDLHGLYACPTGDGPFPAIVALGGSTGGVPEDFLQLLAPEGFAVLALEYFGSPATQAALVEVPLERVAAGARWLLSRPEAASHSGRVGVIGVSKGGELALLAAATFPDLVGPVAAYTPSSVAWAGIDFVNPANLLRSSWSSAGAPVSFVPYPEGVRGVPSVSGLRVRPIYEAGLEQLVAVDTAAIPVERATGPLLLVSGGDDQMWPAGRMCESIVDRVRRIGRGPAVKHVNYPDAGHLLTPHPPALPVSGPAPPMMFDMGGTREATAAAHADAWPRVIAHFRS